MNDYDLWFSLLEISNTKKLLLLKQYKNTYEIWNEYINSSTLEEIKIAGDIAWNKNKIIKLRESINKNNIEITFYNDEFYPKNLLYYEDMPAVIFYKGNIKKLQQPNNVAIVGARNCTQYGKIITSNISKEISRCNINIISGMARGIDSISHNVCIENKGYTCAILGSGIDVIYPPENKDLYNNIIENGGCIISEFLPGTKPYPANFPRRNRIISGLSKLIIIVEAGEKSGSLITAGLALEQGKDVMAVPGSIFSKVCKGTNKLIKDGAYVFTEMKDIFEILDMDYVCKIEDKSMNLNNVQKKVFDIINDSPIHIDEILKLTKVDIKQLYEVLFELQLKDKIISLSGNYYAKYIR